MKLGALTASLAVLAILAGCSSSSPSSKRPVGPSTLTVPSRYSVSTIYLDGVYDSLAQYANRQGMSVDPSQSSKEQGRLVTKRVRCAPNGDQRHTAWCQFAFTYGPAQDNPTAVAVNVQVRVPEKVDYDEYQVAQTVRIEAALDQVVNALRKDFGNASITATDSLAF